MKSFANLIPDVLVRTGLVALILCVGCNSLTTYKGKVSGETVSGIYYYLPRARVRITGTPGSSKATPATPGAGQDKNVQTLGGAPAVDAHSTGGESSLITSYTIQITAELEADTTARYFLQPRTNILYDDTVKFSVNSKGLLTSANVTSQDRTTDIVTAIAGMVKVFGLEGVIPPGKSPLKAFSVVFRPDDPDDVELAKAVVKSSGLDLACPTFDSQKGVILPQSQWDKKEDSTPGIVFRGQRPCTISLSRKGADDINILETQTLLIPDRRRELTLDSSRAPFVTKNSNVTFADGMPQQYDRTLPSQALGFLSIPQAILNAVIPSIPISTKSTNTTTTPKATSSTGSGTSGS